MDSTTIHASRPCVLRKSFRKVVEGLRKAQLTRLISKMQSLKRPFLSEMAPTRIQSPPAVSVTLPSHISISEYHKSLI